MMLDAIRAATRNYLPEDAREAAFRERMLALCDTPEPLLRTTFSPGHFTASAFVVSPARDALLLIFHRKLTRWLQPGGHVEPGDTSPLAAALREVEEETGLRGLSPLKGGLFDIDIHAIPARATEPAHEHFDLRVVLASPTLAVTESDEVAGIRWVPLDEVALLETDESVLRAVRKLGALHTSRQVLA